MNHRDFEISFAGLAQGTHHFSIDVVSSFLEDKPLEEVLGLEARVEITMEKKSTFLNLFFDITGELELNCDMCTEKYTESFSYKEMIVVKYGESSDSDPHDVLFISPNDTSVNVKHMIYEFISVSVPLKRIHKEIKECNQENINFIHNFAHADKAEESEDPRWAALKNIKF